METIKLKILDEAGHTLMTCDADTAVSLVYTNEYPPGDRVALEIDHPGQYCVIQFEDTMPEALVYVVKREINFHIPFGEQAITYSPKSFAGSRHVIRARLALPEENTVLVERIVAMHIPDVFGQPGRVTLTLANRQPTLSDEIADLLREVNASKLIGGKLTELTFRNRATGTYTAPISHPFTLDEYPSVLSCVMRMTADNGVYIQTIMVDGTEIPYSVWGKTQSLDALPYLRRTSTGAVDSGQHSLLMMPTNPGGFVTSVITLKVIEKMGT